MICTFVHNVFIQWYYQLFIEVPSSNSSWRIPYIFKTVFVNKHQSLCFLLITCSLPLLASPSANPSNSSSHYIWEFMGDEGIWTEYQKPVSSSVCTQPNNTVKTSSSTYSINWNLMWTWRLTKQFTGLFLCVCVSTGMFAG